MRGRRSATAALSGKAGEGVSALLTRHAWTDTLTIDVFRCESYPCVRVGGEGEERGAEVLGGILAHLIRSGYTRIIMDTRDLRFMDQHTCTAVVDAINLLDDEDGMLVLVDSSLPVERSLKLLDLERLVHVAPSLSQAVAYLDWHE